VSAADTFPECVNQFLQSSVEPQELLCNLAVLDGLGQSNRSQNSSFFPVWNSGIPGRTLAGRAFDECCCAVSRLPEQCDDCCCAISRLSGPC